MNKPTRSGEYDFTIQETKHGYVVFARHSISTAKETTWSQFRKAGKEHLGELMKRLMYQQPARDNTREG